MDDQINWLKEQLVQAFKGRKKPQRFTTENHCEECDFWDDYLQQIDPACFYIDNPEQDNLTAFSFSSKEGILYLVPALCSVALAWGDKILGRILIILERMDINNLSGQEINALADFIEYFRTQNRPNSMMDIRTLDLMKDKLSKYQ